MAMACVPGRVGSLNVSPAPVVVGAESAIRLVMEVMWRRCESVRVMFVTCKLTYKVTKNHMICFGGVGVI